MSRANIVRDSDGRFYGIRVDCPSGECTCHVLPVSPVPPGETESPSVAGMPHWTFNGNLDRPTFEPSILSSYEFGDDRRKVVCHSFVREGRIEFLGDCTHALAGQTVDLPEVAT